MKNPLPFLLLALAAGVARAEAPADRVLTGGRVLTVDAEDRVAEAIAIRDGRIVAVGTDAEIARFIGPATERIDLAGRTATPGLIDAHVHFSQAGLVRLTHIDLMYPQVRRIADAVELVGERAATARAGRMDSRARLGRGQAGRAALPARGRSRPGGRRPSGLAHAYDRALRRREFDGAEALPASRATRRTRRAASSTATPRASRPASSRKPRLRW